jgi:hypothetical protein
MRRLRLTYSGGGGGGGGGTIDGASTPGAYVALMLGDASEWVRNRPLR